MATDEVGIAVRVLTEQMAAAVGGVDWTRVRGLAEAILLLDPHHAQAALLHRTAMSLLDAAGSPSVLPRAEPPPVALTRHQHSHELDDVVRSGFQLIPFPAVATTLLRMLDDDLTDAEDIARVAATDPALTARILNVANSAFYQRRAAAATIRDALVVLGSREVRSIVVASCLLGAAPRTNVIVRDAFWRFSFVVGMLADIIARSRGSWTGEAFTAGVMHHVGLLALDMYCPEGLEAARQLTSPDQRRLHDRELEVFGFTDADLGARMATGWHLPEPVVHAIAWHGRRSDRFEFHEAAAWAVVRARIFARAQGLHDGIEQSEPRVVTDAMLEAPVNGTLDRMGGWNGFLTRIDTFFTRATP